jgi:hypothetical protein
VTARRLTLVAVALLVWLFAARDAGAQILPQRDAGPTTEVLTPRAAPSSEGAVTPAAGTASHGVAPSSPAAAPTGRGERAVPTTFELVRAVIGLLCIFVLAYLAGHPRVQELEEMLGISAVVTAGLPFVLFGLIAHTPAVGLLSDSVLVFIRPFLPLGLGWIGFSIGFRFDVRRLDTLPRGIGPALLLTSVLPFAAIVGASALILLASGGIEQGTFLRDAIVLGTASIIGVRPPPPNLEGPTSDRIAPLLQLQEGVAMIGLVLVAAFFRPSSHELGWQLPAIAWIFVTLGLGTALAAVIFAVLNSFKNTREITIVMLGAICLAAGMASFLRLSPIAVCFLAGSLMYNLPGSWKEQVRVALVRLERPIYLVFLVVAGAMWKVSAWQGWLLLVLFVAGRLIGKALGVYVSKQERLGAQLNLDLGQLNHEERIRIALAPMGALAIAIVVNAQDLYSGTTVSWMVTTVIGGAVATEVLTHFIVVRLYPDKYVFVPPELAASPSGLAPPPREQTPLPFPLPPKDRP